MDILYARYNRLRAQEYQTETAIGMHQGKMFVRKRALSPAAMSHIEQIHNNHLLLKEQWHACKHIEIVPTQLRDHSVTSPYIDGLSLHDKLMNHIRAGAVDKIYPIMDEYINLIYSLDTEQITKTETDHRFRELFGSEFMELEGQVFKVSNIDITLENVICNVNKYYIIDCEWVYPFPIPVKYTIFRAIQQLWVRIHDLVQISFMDLLDKANISIDEYTTFLSMEKGFLARVKPADYLAQYAQKAVRIHDMTGIIGELSSSGLEGFDQEKQMQASLDQHAGEKRIFIWGTGTAGLRTLSLLQRKGWSVTGFYDNNSGKWGKKVSQLDISNPKSFNPQTDYVVIGSSYYKEIQGQLVEAGYNEFEHFCKGIIS